ncbi:MAG: hypothetical protein IPL53_15990 [Ignavibacteria bacterium]|nr:hypothetical protein [Ignavibacteria bacterium]
MKLIKKILLITALAYIFAALNTGCETPIGQIVPYSGNWKFTFSYDNGSVFASSNILIQDTGAFCGKITVMETGNIFYIKGDVSGYGEITGGFADSCSAPVTGKIIGSFTELMGAGYASGTFTDTLQNPGYKGTWQARRN